MKKFLWVAGIIAILIVIGSNVDNNSPSNSSADSAVTTTDAPTTIESKGQQVYDWYSSTGLNNQLDNAISDIQNVVSSADNYDFPSLQTSCNALYNDALRMKKIGISPDADLTIKLGKFYSDIEQGSVYCVNAVRNNSPAQLNTATQYMSHFTVDAQNVTDYLTQLKGQ